MSTGNGPDRMAKHRQQVAGETRREWETLSGRETEALYGPDAEDARGWKAHDENLGFPGEFPFTRGPYASMYRGKFWTMRQFAGFGSASDTNRRYRFLLDHGQTGLSVAFDMPTLMGYDSDHQMSDGEVGREGVAIDTLADMRALLDGIDLEKISVSLTINP
ncbi:MAG: methylmalonyl-CoA mutase family protein, partial [Gemmatimonadota bacterium]|nr:methylmalonyl-CoA mutase family protein [Gemmatimonadota bacterium]